MLGFTRMEVYTYIFREIGLLAVMGDVVGMVLGIFLERFVVTTAEVDYVMFGRSIHAPSFAYAFAHFLVGRRGRIDGSKDGHTRAEGLVGISSHVHQVAHVVLGHARHAQPMALAHRVAHVVLVVQHDLVAFGQTILEGELLGDQHRVIVEG